MCQVMDEGLYKDEDGLSATQLEQARVGRWLAPSRIPISFHLARADMKQVIFMRVRVRVRVCSVV